MIQLILDTSYIGLNIGLLKDDVLIEKVEIEANRKQSELTMPYLAKLFKKHSIDPLSIDQVIITEGPGSFTGLRIAMTIGKVIAAMTHCELYTMNTLLAYVHPSIEKGMAIMDARSKRAYIAIIEKGVFTTQPYIQKLNEFASEEILVFGDAHLIHQESQPFSIIDNIVAYKNDWQKVEDIDALAPVYLKENSSYGR